MQLVKRLIAIYFLLFSYINGASNPNNSGIDIVVIKQNQKETTVKKIHFTPEYAKKIKKMSYRSANIYIKELLIQAYKQAKLNYSELGKFHIFISKKQLQLFKSTGLLMVRLNYKAKAYTQVIMKVLISTL